LKRGTGAYLSSKRRLGEDTKIFTAARAYGVEKPPSGGVGKHRQGEHADILIKGLWCGEIKLLKAGKNGQIGYRKATVSEDRAGDSRLQCALTIHGQRDRRDRLLASTQEIVKGGRNTVLSPVRREQKNDTNEVG